MNVEKTIVIDSEHSLEFGSSSWNDNEKAVRRRKETNGKFDVFSSSEISISGHLNIADVFTACVNEDLIDKKALTQVLKDIAASLERQHS